MYSPAGDPTLPDNAVVYVIGKVCIECIQLGTVTKRALINATHLRSVPGDVKVYDPNYEDRLHNFSYLYIDWFYIKNLTSVLK